MNLLEKLIQFLIDQGMEGYFRSRRAHQIRFKFTSQQFSAEGDNMTFTFKMSAGQIVAGIGSPINGLTPPGASSAKLSNQAYTSSDPTVFTVVPDPNVVNGLILTKVADGTATLTETATATEPDGTTTEKIQGVATIIMTSVPPPPPPPAASIVFTFGTPTTPTPTPVP